jgi:hypothetical protein
MTTPTMIASAVVPRPPAGSPVSAYPIEKPSAPRIATTRRASRIELRRFAAIWS